VVERVGDLLNRRFAKALNGARILVLGVAYKQDIDDYRESPAIRVIEGLRKEGAEVVFYDPFVAKYRGKGEWFEGEKALSAELLEGADAVVITTAHTTVDYGFVQQHAKAIFDTKNVTKSIADRDNIEVL
ncbi:MAG: UDP-N-acetyl-D-glucosamine dehydrogenase, partial [Bacteroidales bacterium]|nr:UDP-N-acetyl-D-glucosamine dehydrogenase [Bacteroidales bacterium]